MVQPYFIAAPVGLGALVLQRTFRRKKGPRDEEVRRRDGDGDETAFACERVCSSDRLIKRLGYLSKVRLRLDASSHPTSQIFLTRVGPKRRGDVAAGPANVRRLDARPLISRVSFRACVS